MATNDQTETTGTQQREDGDAVVQTPTTVTPAAADRDAKSGEVEQLKALLLAQKEKIEEANRILKAEAERSAAAPSPAASGTRRDIRGAVKAAADAGDPAAEAILELERNILLREELRDIPAEERDEVRQHFEKNAYRLGDLKAARAELRESRLDDEVRRLREENEQLKKPPDPEVVNAPPTHGRETTARGNTIRKMTYEEFDKEAARIAAQDGEMAERKFRAQVGKSIALP